MNIRDTFFYLQKYDQKAFKMPLRLHVVFLMLVIRISDYFQTDASRINFLPFLLQHFKSNFSYEEHKKQLQVIKLQELHDEPETYFATAEPTNVKHYLALKRLFSSIQAELDLSWAIHGEIYGHMSAVVPTINPSP
jgi:molecular chaperone HtpG